MNKINLSEVLTATKSFISLGLSGQFNFYANDFCDTFYRSMVCPSVCMSPVTLVHPAKAIGQNEVPFGRDTRAVPSNTVLDRSSGPPREGDLGAGTPSSQRCHLLPNYFGIV